ncbi:MAG: 50S ribosomal protein L25 [Paenibacillaceae bacterium]
MSDTIHLQERAGSTKSDLKQMRAQGNIPAVVYGQEIGSIQVTVSEKEIVAAMKKNTRAILEAVLPSNKMHPVLIQEYQRDSISGKLLHIDFHQINMNQSIETMVTIHFTGESSGVKEGGILQVETHAVQVRCMPKKLPDTIEVDISKLGIGDHLLVSDLMFEQGVEILTDPSAMLVTILAIQKKDEALEPDVAAEEGKVETKESVEAK